MPDASEKLVAKVAKPVSKPSSSSNNNNNTNSNHKLYMILLIVAIVILLGVNIYFIAAPTSKVATGATGPAGPTGPTGPPGPPGSSGGSSGALPTGTIIAWQRPAALTATVNIPDGWRLCDGNNGTPDLRKKFICGAENDVRSDFKLNNEGGSKTKELTLENIPPHTHKVSIDTASGDAALANNSGTHVWSKPLYSNTGSAGGAASGKAVPFDIMPPYYCLYYIIKI